MQGMFTSFFKVTKSDTWRGNPVNPYKKSNRPGQLVPYNLANPTPKFGQTVPLYNYIDNVNLWNWKVHYKHTTYHPTHFSSVLPTSQTK